MQNVSWKFLTLLVENGLLLTTAYYFIYNHTIITSHDITFDTVMIVIIGIQDSCYYDTDFESIKTHNFISISLMPLPTGQLRQYL